MAPEDIVRGKACFELGDAYQQGSILIGQTVNKWFCDVFVVSMRVFKTAYYICSIHFAPKLTCSRTMYMCKFSEISVNA